MAAVALLDTIMANKDETMNGTTQVETAPVMETEASKADPKFAHVPLTPELLAALRTAAGNAALGPFVAQLLGEKYGVTIERTDGRKRYSTEEERESAKLASRDKAANLRKALLAAHRARMANDSVKLAEAEANIALYS